MFTLHTTSMRIITLALLVTFSALQFGCAFIRAVQKGERPAFEDGMLECVAVGVLGGVAGGISENQTERMGQSNVNSVTLASIFVAFFSAGACVTFYSIVSDKNPPGLLSKEGTLIGKAVLPRSPDQITGPEAVQATNDSRDSELAKARQFESENQWALAWGAYRRAKELGPPSQFIDDKLIEVEKKLGVVPSP